MQLAVTGDSVILLLTAREAIDDPLRAQSTVNDKRRNATKRGKTPAQTKKRRFVDHYDDDNHESENRGKPDFSTVNESSSPPHVSYSPPSLAETAPHFAGTIDGTFTYCI